MDGVIPPMPPCRSDICAHCATRMVMQLSIPLVPKDCLAHAWLPGNGSIRQWPQHLQLSQLPSKRIQNRRREAGLLAFATYRKLHVERQWAKNGWWWISRLCGGIKLTENKSGMENMRGKHGTLELRFAAI